MFIKYEDLKDDINTQVNNVAGFLGFGFTMDEKKQGLIEKISNRCNLKILKFASSQFLTHYQPQP